MPFDGPTETGSADDSARRAVSEATARLKDGALYVPLEDLQALLTQAALAYGASECPDRPDNAPIPDGELGSRIAAQADMQGFWTRVADFARSEAFKRASCGGMWRGRQLMLDTMPDAQTEESES